ncbi:MAG: hypothetical protein HY392_00490 [Candidatus Diapherotrites archaeon]|nr:hypothetical protein [Candidatus Diapherotrites archaeon]
MRFKFAILIPLVLVLLVLFGCTQSSTGEGFSVTKTARQLEPQTTNSLTTAPQTKTGSSQDGNNPQTEPRDTNRAEPSDVYKKCDVPKFDLNQSYFAYLNSRIDSYEFANADVNLNIPQNSQKCYFYQYKGQAPVLIYPRQTIHVTSDALFNSTGMPDLQDLVAEINSDKYVYVGQFTTPIPTDLDFNQGDVAVIPFMGGRYQVLEMDKDQNGGMINSIKLKNIVRQSEVFMVANHRGFPFDQNQVGNFKWVSEIRQSPGTINGVEIGNDRERWVGGNGIYDNPPLYGLDNLHNKRPNSADFLNGTGHQKEDFAKTWFNGFEAKPKTTMKIGGGMLTFDDSNVSFEHRIPFFVTLNVGGNSSFLFDGKTIYYRFNDMNNVFSYRYDQNQNWRNISYVEGNVTSPFPLVGGASQTYYYRLFVDREEFDGYLILNGSTPQNRIFTKYGKIIEFLGTDLGEDGRVDKQYYVPDLSDFGGGIANEYWVAHFKVKEFPSRHSSDITEFIQTDTHDFIIFPNSQLSYYDSDVNYANSLGVRWILNNDPASVAVKKAFTDYGTRIELDANAGTINHLVPQTQPRVFMGIQVKER